MAIYVYTDEFIREPGENTILYMPFNNDLLDHSNNNIQFTNTNTVLENNTAYFNGSANLINSTFTNYLNSAPFTCSVRVKSKTFNNDSRLIGCEKATSSTWNGWSIAQISSSGNTYRAEMTAGGSSTFRQIFTPLNLNEWDLLTYVKTPTELLFYKNGTLIGTQTSTTGTFQTELSIGQGRGATSTSDRKHFNGWMSELIIENKARTAEEISDYYNGTKSNYGIQ